jgi:hypothetical protein
MPSKNDELDDDSRSGVAEHVPEVIDLVDTDSEDEAPAPIRRRVLRSSTRSLRKPAPAVAAAADIPRPRAVSDASTSIKKRTAAMSTSEESDDGSDTSRFSEKASSVNEKPPAKKKAKNRKLPSRAAKSKQLLNNESHAKSKKNKNKNRKNAVQLFGPTPEPLGIITFIDQNFYLRMVLEGYQLKVCRIEPDGERPLPRTYGNEYILMCSKFQKKDRKGHFYRDKDDGK